MRTQALATVSGSSLVRYAKSRWKAGIIGFSADREASGAPWKPGDQTQTVTKVPADDAIA